MKIIQTYNLRKIYSEIIDLMLKPNIFVLIFATCLGGLAGLYPAYQASKMDPVRALKMG